MSSFGSFLSDKALAITIVLLIGIVALAILLYIYRLLFGRRLHMASGRPRQPRLGVVDAFDLDRQRQLVLIRRDNVEHLVMIGGPNDLVIESAFVRMQPNVLPLGRDKDGAAGATPPVVPMALPIGSAVAPSGVPSVSVETPAASPLAAQAPLVETGERARSAAPPLPAAPPLDLTDPLSTAEANPLADIPAPAPVTLAPATAETPAATPDQPASDEPSDVPATPPPTPPAPVRPSLAGSRFASTFPPRQLGTTGSALPPRPPLSSLRTPTAPVGPPAPRPSSTGPRPMPSAPLSRGTSAASLRRDPPAPPAGPSNPVEPAAAPDAPTLATDEPPVSAGTPGAEASPPAEPAPVISAPAPAPPPPLQAARPAPTLPTTLDTLESLEEEMAKLLGRPPSGASKG